MPPAAVVPTLELRGVFQHVGAHCALADISLGVAPGQGLLIIGPNGAGKSLLTRLILGLDSPSAGSVHLFGQDLATTGDPGMRAIRRRLGAVLQGGSLINGLTVLENLLLPLRATPMSRNEMNRCARLVMTQLQLDGMENHRPRALSIGQRRRVELARALINRPRLLVWDGLTDGLDPPAVRDMIAVLQVQQTSGDLTFIATDNNTVEAIAGDDRVLVLDRGRVLFDGTRGALQACADERLDLRYILRGQP